MIHLTNEEDKIVVANAMTTLHEVANGATEIDGVSIAETAKADFENLRGLFGTIEL